jgi:hypothetical protein
MIPLVILGAVKVVGYHYGVSTLSVAFISGGAYVRKRGRYIYSCTLDARAENSKRDPSTLRKGFNNLPLAKHKPNKHHTHPRSARDRTCAVGFTEDFADRVGLDYYALQKSNSEARRELKGSRVYYWAKDTSVRPEEFDPGEDAVVSIVDVDYYIDMPEHLAENFVPHILYTLQPCAASINEEEYSMYWKEDNSVVYRVSGGGRYTHKLWDYGPDCVMTTSYILGLIPYKTATYLIDRRFVDEHHQLVCLTPLKRWTGLWSLLARWLDCAKLKRMEPVKNGFVRFLSQTDKGLKVSVSRVGDSASSTLPYDRERALAAQARNGPKVTLSQVMAWFDHEKDLTERRACAAIFYDYFRANTEHDGYEVCPVSESVRYYDHGFENPTQDDKPAVVPFMSPLYDEAYVPKLTVGNAKRAIRDRIEKVQHKKLFNPTPFVSSLAREFLDLMVPECPNLIPVEEAYILEKQSKPSQRSLIYTASVAEDLPKLEAFIKREAYTKPKAPRVITVDQPAHKFSYSSYIYAVMEYCKTSYGSGDANFFIPGKTPKQVAERVATIASRSVRVTSADAVKLDGSISSFIRDVYNRFLTRLFHPRYKEELTKLYDASYNKTVRMGVGNRDEQTKDDKDSLSYDSLWIILSGMIDTSVFGTFTSIFCMYVSIRTWNIGLEGEKRFMQPKEAFELIKSRGGAMGDDVIIGDVPAKAVQNGARAIGLVSEATSTERGHEGVEFLSRRYGPDVWEEDPTSVTCLKRQLSKFHTTVKLCGVSEVDKLKEKARAYLLTDRNTPVLGEYCRRVEELYGRLHRTVATRNIERWQSDIAVESQYPNEFAEWMENYAREDLDYDFVAFRRWLENATKEDILSPPLFHEHEEKPVKEPVEVSGDVIIPEPVKDGKTTKPKKKRKRNVRARGGKTGYGWGGRRRRSARGRQ